MQTQTLTQWLDEAERLQQSSPRKCMMRDTPTGQLGIALKIIRAIIFDSSGTPTMWMVGKADRIINETAAKKETP